MREGDIWTITVACSPIPRRQLNQFLLPIVMFPARIPYLQKALALLCATAATATVVGQIEVTDFRIVGGQVRMEVTDHTGSPEVPRVQSSTNLEQWPKDFGAVIDHDANGPDRHVITIPVDTADPKFFRVLGLNFGPGVDPDGDGLPTDYENNSTPDSNPDPLLFDTDDDGYNDGREIALGTDPTDPEDYPKLDGLPAVEFTAPISAFTEGTASEHSVPLQFDQAYTGNVYYTVNVLSTATGPTDFVPLSGSVFVNGTSGSIDISFVDDLIIRKERLLIIDLNPDPPVGM